MKTRHWHIIVSLYTILTGSAFAKEVCPSSQSVHSVDVFDGDPKNLTDLMADAGNSRKGYFILKNIYKKGRFVTIRCIYNDQHTIDIKLDQPVAKCSYKYRIDKTLSFECRP